MRKTLEISKILEKPEKFSEKEVLVCGWVKSLRNSKKKFFLVVNDGSTIENLQIVIQKNEILQEKLRMTGFGSFVKVLGFVEETPEREQNIEIKCKEILFISKADKNFPLQKKDEQAILLRENSHLKPKASFFLAIFRIRSELNKIINDFFYKEKFLYVNTPIITTNDAEGGGESFEVISRSDSKFFGKKSNLSVSGQLHQESMAQGMQKVYNFSPCFRAEKSNTTRHLSEFWMVEAEISSFKIKDLLKIIEKFLKFIIKSVVKNCEKELKYLEKYHSKKIIDELKFFSESKIKTFTYKKCLQEIELKNKKDKNFFEFNEIRWGMDFKSEHEKYLCDFFESPIFIINYPVVLKSFYMKINKDDETVSAVDLIVPQIGELIGGSVREESVKKMKERLTSKKARNELNWYFELRKYGYSGSAGFGMGFERLLMFITKCENIRELIQFHRSYKELNF